MTFTIHSSDIHVTFMIHSGDIQKLPETFRAHSGDIQVTFTVHSSDIQVTFMIHSGDIQELPETFSNLPASDDSYILLRNEFFDILHRSSSVCGG